MLSATAASGEYYDSETGTIYLRARHYNPSNGRFTQRDSYVGRNGEPLSLNLYTYCYNNPVFFADPTGLDSYIFYLDEWLEEALEHQKDLESIYKTETHLIEVGSAQDILEGWNSMGKENGKTVGIDTVIINTHASASTLSFGNGNSMSRTDIANLERKYMKSLILLGCNAGHLDHSLSNPAATFAQRSGSIVLASDGTVMYSKGKLPIFKNKMLKFIKNKKYLYTPEANEHFFKDSIKNKNGQPIRTENKGWVIYRNSGVPETGWFGKTTNMKQMINGTNKALFSRKKEG